MLGWMRLENRRNLDCRVWIGHQKQHFQHQNMNNITSELSDIRQILAAAWQTTVDRNRTERASEACAL